LSNLILHFATVRWLCDFATAVDLATIRRVVWPCQAAEVIDSLHKSTPHSRF
jgi:hypothetical protein